MYRRVIQIILYLLFFISSGVWAAEVTIDGGRYHGFFGIGGSGAEYSSHVTLNLEPGVHKVWIATTPGFSLIVNNDSTLKLGKDAEGRALLKGNIVQFITHPRRINTDKRLWKIKKVTPPTFSPKTLYLVSGSGYELWFYQQNDSRLQKTVFEMSIDGTNIYTQHSIEDDINELNLPTIPASVHYTHPATKPTRLLGYKMEDMKYIFIVVFVSFVALIGMVKRIFPFTLIPLIMIGSWLLHVIMFIGDHNLLFMEMFYGGLIILFVFVFTSLLDIFLLVKDQYKDKHKDND